MNAQNVSIAHKDKLSANMTEGTKVKKELYTASMYAYSFTFLPYCLFCFVYFIKVTKEHISTDAVVKAANRTETSARENRPRRRGSARQVSKPNTNCYLLWKPLQSFQ